ncbi:MAG: formimidoylglutamate deiminase [Acidimicrobiia bacterium]|nr:formimidoylglutamate deiminase [Acidimicrobiia bacterium]
MARWFGSYAWLGGPDLARDVTIEVAAGRVVGVTTGSDPAGATRLAGVILPGLVSAHSHAFHRALRGKTHNRGGDFWTWRDQMYAVASRLDPAGFRILAAHVFAEMLRAGITTVGEFHYLHHQPDGTPYPEPNAMSHALIDAAAETGIRLTLIDTCYLASAADGTPVTAEQRRFSDGSASRWANRVHQLAETIDTDRLKLGVAAHSVRAVPAADLPAVAQLARDLSCPIHIHVSEQRSENDESLALHGISPTRLLEETGVLGPSATAVHATHMVDGDLDVLAASGSTVCLCPTTERDLGDGIGPAAEFRAAGVPISLGSDSNAVVDLFEEARAMELDDRLRLEQRGVHAPHELMVHATTDGLASLGWGTHTPFGMGAPADFVSLDTDCDPAAGYDHRDGIGGLLFSSSRGNVRDVVVGGTLVVKAGHNLSGHGPSGLAAEIRRVTS